MDVNDNAPCLDDRVVWTFIASRLAPTGDRVQTCNQVGCQAASLWFLIWLLIFLLHRGGPCRSEHAREKPESIAGCQAPHVIVDLHREQARSYRIFCATRDIVEAAIFVPAPAIGQYTGARQAFHRYNARLDRDSLKKKYYVPAQTSPGIAQPRP
jgi:hypothetical protein